MCIFSGAALRQRVDVSATKMFARMTASGVQALVYSMSLSSDDDLAMVLPLPVDAVPAYADHGFAVFQLKPGTHTIQPMAFEFPTRDQRLFFPTVHLHDGKWHKTAKFDHALYFQHANVFAEHQSLSRPAKDYAGIVDRAHTISRKVIKGVRTNADTWVG